MKTMFLIIINLARHVKHFFIRKSRSVVINATSFIISKYARNKIISGPFSGVTRSDECIYGAPMAKLLGTYESELHDFFNMMSGLYWRRIIDVGAADGYYAIGIAVRWNVDQVISYELLEKGRDIIGKSASINGVYEKIQNYGLCEENDLYDITTPDSRDLLIMDVEGAELELLSIRVVERLKNSILAIEAHDFLLPGCSQELAKRLGRYHRVNVIMSRERVHREFPLPWPMPKWLKRNLMNEGRPAGMNWLIAVPYPMDNFSGSSVS